MDAFNRHSATAVSSMGYDTGMPNGQPGYASSQGSIPSGTPAAVEMSDATKRGRGDPPSPAASSVRPLLKRSSAQAPSPLPATAYGTALPQSSQAPPPSSDAVRLAALTTEVAALQAERAGFRSRVVAAEAAAQAVIQSSEAAVSAVRAELAESARQGTALRPTLDAVTPNSSPSLGPRLRITAPSPKHR